MRTKNEIDRDMKVSMADLDRLIGEAVEYERISEAHCKSLENHIKALKKETSYEETPTGQIDKLVKETDNAIKDLIDDLEQKTGFRFELHKKHS